MEHTALAFASCPKTMTNGPCGGVGDDGTCEVDSRTCVWWERFDGPGTGESTPLGELRPAPDWSREDHWTAAFADAAPHRPSTHRPSPHRTGPPVDLGRNSDRPMRVGSTLERLLHEGRFVVTCEINPPDSADPTNHLELVRSLIGIVDAVHISDNSLASPHMCGLAMASLIERLGMETILHMTCRDRNRNMLQADLLGAAALGIRHVLCITGDHPAIGDHPETKPVFDLDSVSWIRTARQLRDEATLLSGRPLESAPKLLIGGGAEPTAPPTLYRPQRLAVKVEAGIDFAVTQVVYDMNALRTYMKKVCDLGLDRKIHILVSVGALGGPAMARGMNSATPGVTVPEHVITRLEAAPAGKRREEGVKICVEQIEELVEMPGVSGIDIMDVDPARYSEIVERAGITQRPMAANGGATR